MFWQDKNYFSFNYYVREKFGEKLYKLSFDAGFSCPNRDGTKSLGGCIFCSEKGSGDFAVKIENNIIEQFISAKNYLKNRNHNNKFIGYLQAFTNTYAPIDILEKTYSQILDIEEVVALSIGTRPDCIDENIVNLLKDLKEKYNKEIIVELGFQTSKKESIELINRQYDNKCFEDACKLLKANNISIVCHVILGLPFENKDDMLNTVSYCCENGIDGIKLQLLHVLKNTELAKMYYDKIFETLTFEKYVDIVVSCLEIIPQNIVIHRLTGDGPRDILIAPIWEEGKFVTLNEIDKQLKLRNTYQGKYAKAF